jgi:hypothetical protein
MRLLSRSFALALLALSACQTPDDVESASQQINGENVYPVQVNNSNTRYVRMKCQQFCSVITGKCGDWCEGSGLKEIMLLANRGDTSAYPATANGEYRGCGVSAIGNMLNYITGAHNTTYSVYGWAGSHNWALPWPLDYLNSNQGMTPDMLEEMLQYGLANSEHRYHTAKIHNAKLPAALPDIIASLKAGYPVAMLVNNGNHWQLITGYRAPDTFWMIDYTTPKSNQPLKERKFSDLGFDSLSSALSALHGFQGVHPGTYIKITGYDLIPHGTPGAGTGGGDGVPCGDSSSSPQCPAGQQLNSFCQCDCPEADRQSCNNQLGREYDNSTCTCKDGQGL